MNSLRKKLLETIEEHNTDYSKLERSAGLSKNFISHIICEKSKNPGIYSIIKLANALNMNVYELVGIPEKHSPKSIEIKNLSLFLEIMEFVLNKLKKCTQKIQSLDVFNAILNIYTYSIPKNKMSSKFATWYIKNYLL